MIRPGGGGGANVAWGGVGRFYRNDLESTNCSVFYGSHLQTSVSTRFLKIRQSVADWHKWMRWNSRASADRPAERLYVRAMRAARAWFSGWTEGAVPLGIGED